jgi:hypothetical protein
VQKTIAALFQHCCLQDVLGPEAVGKQEGDRELARQKAFEDQP